MGASGKIHLLHCVFQVATSFRIELATLANLLRAHRGIGGEPGGFETRNLYISRDGDPLPDHLRGFTSRPFRGKFTEINKRNINMDINTVKEVRLH